MNFPERLKQDLSILGFVPAMMCILLFSLTWIFFGPQVGFAAAGAFFILYAVFSLWIYARTTNLSYVAAFFFQFFFGLYFITHPKLSVIKGMDLRFSGLILILGMASAIWLFYLYFRKMAKWKGREVFELASVSAEPEPDGFTERPRPAGKTEYTKSELTGFARFLSRNLIAMPYFEEDRIIFLPVKMDDAFSYLFNPHKFRQNRSWIAFDFEGNVTVNISHRDYLSYKEELSFDQLCDNMGKLFIRFMEYYRKGEAERIIYRLNELGLGLTS